MVGLRMDRAVQGRLDASDIVQDVLVEADRRLADYLATAKMPFLGLAAPSGRGDRYDRRPPPPPRRRARAALISEQRPAGGVSSPISRRLDLAAFVRRSQSDARSCRHASRTGVAVSGSSVEETLR